MPGVMADICRRVAEARNREASTERHYRLEKYRVEQELRNYYRSGGYEKKPTEDAIEMEVALRASVMALGGMLVEWKAEVRLLEAELQAYTCKRDMLVSLSAYVRSEMETLRLSNAR